MECTVCTERFNKSNRSPVKCPTCEYKVCSGCTEAYLCQTTEDAHCMNCRVGWTRETLHSCGLTQKFVNLVYKKRREDILYDREKSMMPATQPYVERELLIRNNKKIIEQKRKFQSHLLSERSKSNNMSTAQISAKIGMDSYVDCALWRLDEFYKHTDEISLASNEIARLESHNVILSTSQVDIKKEARKFIRACPNNNCKGFLSHVWRCGICEMWSCPTCHEVKGLEKDSPHTCDPNNVDTARLIEKDSKPCPKCASLIFKIEGCDQMWCTQCTTAFSWRTGSIEMGRIHNPHYYEYRRNQGSLPREIGDIPCGGMPSIMHVDSALKKFTNDRVEPNIYGSIIRLHWHISEVVIPRLRETRENNLDLRIKYMINDIPAEVFKQKIQQREKASSKKIQIMNILNTYQLVTSEIMQRLVASESIKDMLETSKEFDMIRQYTNDLMQKVTVTYGCVTPRIIENYQIIHGNV